MNDMITPIVFFCAFIHGEPNVCDGHTAIASHKLELVSTPTQCYIDAMEDASKSLHDFKEEHPNKETSFRIVCKRTGEKV